MKFKVITGTNPKKVDDKNMIYLTPSGWDDWFEFSTLYIVQYVGFEGEVKRLGSTKIGQVGLKGSRTSEKGFRRPEIPDNFEILPDDFFSLGQDVGYYNSINEYLPQSRALVYEGLRDIAYNEDSFKKACNERVYKVSLLREVSQKSVTGQFRQFAQGNAVLSPYLFDYTSPGSAKSPSYKMEFKVIPKSHPPTNIHVIIGRNGVGKTHLINNMIKALVNDNLPSKHGSFSSPVEDHGRQIFANLVSVTFSAFDESEPIAERRDKTEGIKYSYIGLRRISKPGEQLQPPKSPTILKNEFVKSLEMCYRLSKMDIWRRLVKMLDSDPIFEESNVSSLAENHPDDINFKEDAAKLFHKFSSGHKIVLLTITRLVENIEEKSLVLLDEPEAHLHPPLLAAFIRVLSELMVSRNGVAIIATHSPVVLQEVPKSCVWKLRRNGLIATVDNLQLESFGENVGALTREVFGLEVTHSGYHRLIADAVEESDDFDDVLGKFKGEIGLEGQAIARTLMLLKSKQ